MQFEYHVNEITANSHWLLLLSFPDGFINPGDTALSATGETWTGPSGMLWDRKMIVSETHSGPGYGFTMLCFASLVRLD